jgi:hypothetical protein
VRAVKIVIMFSIYQTNNEIGTQKRRSFVAFGTADGQKGEQLRTGCYPETLHCHPGILSSCHSDSERSEEEESGHRVKYNIHKGKQELKA